MAFPFVMTAALTALAGCYGDAGDAMDLESDSAVSAQLELEAANALVPNALVPNALVPNALVPNALVPNALVPNALAPNALASIKDPGAAGEMSRAFLRYAVGCAFRPDQSLAFAWTDADGVEHEEEFVGALGLAPQWQTAALDEAGQRWVSACLAARTNWYGVPVTLSTRARAASLVAPTAQELASYPIEEGAFWGNLFAPTPKLYACHAAANVSHARSLQRDCAAGHVDGQNVVECGIIEIVGTCEDSCDPLTGSGQYHPRCGDPAQPTQKTGHVITVFLE
ncbi:hypothetical protein [Polyangium aurulentum]|uniref:hypothetical protein n=1 Tax=Polyangium aurulentum TaxID=2567896 RepID=UPI0010AE33C4|nr:hypothetical protein [Polyangium aurulentum]UQA56234.1 hypothetical protein E8A73_033695 [Polyangium aurulentum]